MDAGKPQILVVDNDAGLREAIVEILTVDGFEAYGVSSAEDAQGKLAETAYDVLITAIDLPGKPGVALLDDTLARHPETVGILLTGPDTIERAVQAIKSGAYYLTRPFKLLELSIMVRKGLKERTLRLENQYLRGQLNSKYAFDNIVGTGRGMSKVFELVRAVAGLTSTVLIQGETGTGKELIAKTIHFNSPRRDRKIVSLDCGAIPENLLESELFGQEKGAFTRAGEYRAGRLEHADNGTIFLDEIGSLPPLLQAKLLRLLQEREFERVGGSATVKVDVRIVAASSCSLGQKVKDGTFREDLYYRLNVIPIQLPALRERREDIPLLTQRFISEFCERHKLEPKTVSPEVMTALVNFGWPGNVRQLENLVERMVALTGNRTAVLPSDLPAEIGNREASGYTPVIEIPEEGIQFTTIITGMERELILQSLRKAHGNKKLAAKFLNLKRTTLIEKIKRIGLSADESSSFS